MEMLYVAIITICTMSANVVTPNNADLVCRIKRSDEQATPAIYPDPFSCMKGIAMTIGHVGEQLDKVSLGSHRLVVTEIACEEVGTR